MAIIDDLIKQIDDENLQKRIQVETDKLIRQKKFGLVFENHLPECTPLYGIPVQVGSAVSLKNGNVDEIYIVKDLQENQALCVSKGDGQEEMFDLKDIVATAEFGESIYPYLQIVDSISNAPDSDLWHTLIEADNYHALQLLEYLYAGKVDCIYIDPPYNTGARDWKYNNDYVDTSDAYRHSKWLSMMEKRLKLAKRILNPETGVLIVTIDHNELNNLGLLLDQLFSNVKKQIVTIVINPKGSSQDRLSRVDEYAIFVFMSKSKLSTWNDNMLGKFDTGKKVRWAGLIRSGSDAQREDSPNQFYPILIDKQANKVVGAGETLPLPQHPNLEANVNGYSVAWPIRTDGSEGRWMVSQRMLNELNEKGYVSLGRYDSKRKTWAISYLNEKLRRQIDSGEIEIVSRSKETGVVNLEYKSLKNQEVRTVWHRALHNAGSYGSDMLKNILGEGRKFSFPKSLYAVRDTLGIIVKDNPNALVVDFFAGSGTTLHAINLLNAEDHGKRRCILVTNNELSESESKKVKEQGYAPGDCEWEAQGICRSVTWPRTKNSILGMREDGIEISGEYITTKMVDITRPRQFQHISFVSGDELNTITKKKQFVALLGSEHLAQSLVQKDSKYIVPDNNKYSSSILFDENALDEWLDELTDKEHITQFYIMAANNRIFNTIKMEVENLLGDVIEQKQMEIPMSYGFKANAIYFKLDFLDKASVALGRQFRELLPVLWMKAGSVGACPELEGEVIPKMLILPNNCFAVLTDERKFPEFSKRMNETPEIETIYIVTNSERGYREMANKLQVKTSYQLYRDYLDNFRINT